MTQSTTTPDVWSGEEILFTMEVAGDATAIELAGVVDPATIKINGGDKDGEAIVLGNGGRAWKQIPQKEITIEFDAYTRGIQVENGATVDMVGFEQFFDGQTEDTTDELLSSNTRIQKKFRVSLMKTEDTTATSASGTSATSKSAKRFAVANARMVKHEEEYSDYVWKVSVSFKIPPYKLDKTANFRRESTDGSGTTGLSALTTFTDTTNW